MANKKKLQFKEIVSGSAQSNGHHGHSHENPMSITRGINKVLALRLIVAALLFVLGHIFGKEKEQLELLFIALATITAGYDVMYKALTGVLSGRFFDEYFLITIAVAAAFLIGQGEEAAAVTILFQLGILLQDLAVVKTRDSVERLMDLKGELVTVIREDGEVDTDVWDVKQGDTLAIKPGDRVALDCVVTVGETNLDLSYIAGDGASIAVKPGDHILAGSINVTGYIRAEVTAVETDSTAARIMRLVGSEHNKKSNTDKFITRFSRIYTPIVIGIAILLAIFLPIFTDIPISESIHRALVFLVVACPCAMVISIPLTYFSAMGGAASAGVLFKDANAIDTIAKAKTIVFDQTGTLTTGNIRVMAVKSQRMEADMLLKISAHAVAYSQDEKAKAIVAAYKEEPNLSLVDSFTEHPGKGVTVYVGGNKINIGGREFFDQIGIRTYDDDSEMAVFVAINSIYAGRILLTDSLKEDVPQAISQLKEIVGDRIIMLSPQGQESAKAMADSINITEFYPGCTGKTRVARVKDIKASMGKRGSLVYVGDSIRDAGVSKNVDVSVALNGIKAKSAIAGADVIIMDDSPQRVTSAINAGRHARSIIFQNIAIPIAIKLIILFLGARGITYMWTAVFADVGVTLLAVLNSTRAYFIKK